MNYDKIMSMINTPPVSILIVTLNSERTIGNCLNYIKKQKYPNIKEILVIDGGSADETKNIIKNSGLRIKIVDGKFRNNQEARRGIGIRMIRSDLCAMIDSDNYLLDENWIRDMITPLLENKEVVASQTLRYSAPKGETIFNRYFGFMGATDPVAYYLGKSDRLSWIFDKWNLRGKVISENKKYYVIKFDPDNFLTVGCNGIIFRKNILLMSDWKKPEEYMHTDVFVDIARKGHDTFAIVKNEIFHDTSENIFNFFKKRRNYMMLHYNKLNSTRRFKVFDDKRTEDYLKLFLFICFTVTLLEPILVSIRGFLKYRDVAWFIHPFICFGIMTIYTEAIIRKLLNNSK